MADVNINKFRASVVRDGSKPASPGFIVSEGQDPVNPPGTNNYVPYSGATANVELGEYGVEAGFITLDTTPTNTPTDQGTIFWDADDETVDIVLNGYTMKIGEDLFYPVKNQTGSTIAKGVAVRFNGTVGNSGRLLIAPFIADGSVPSSRFMGVTAEEILNGEDGKVLYFGRVRGINTNAFNEGDILYASTTIAGGYQTAIPVAPNNIVQVAAVVTKSATVGTIFVRPTLGSNINKDEGVKIVSVADKNLLQYQSGTSLWENKSLAQVLGGTSAQFVKGDGSLDSTSYGTGTVTSVGLSSATSGVTIGSTPVTTSGTITLAIATASGSQNGLLSSTDWTTFNGKQNALTNPVTGTGTSGQIAYFSGTSAITSESGLTWDATNNNLSIGGVTANSNLTVSGSDNTNIFTVLSGLNSRLHIGTVTSPNNDVYIRSQNNYNLKLGTNNTNYLTIFNSGNVFIGTSETDNGARLQVSGTANFTDNVQSSSFFRSNTPRTNSITIGVSANANYGYIGNDNMWGFRTGTSGDFNIDVNNSSSPINPFKIAQNGTSTFSGVVEANTSLSSIYDFGIRNTGTGNTRLRIGNATSAARLTFTLGAAASEFARIGTEGSFPLHLQTSGADRLTITSSGNVGIGTAIPDSFNAAADNLVVGTTSGNNGITIVGGTTGYSCLFMADGTTGNQQFRGFIQYYHTNDNLEFGTAGSNKMILTSSGNVLIGTQTDSGAKFRVFGTGVSANIYSDNNTYCLGLGYQGTLHGYIGGISSALYGLSANGGQVFLNSSSVWAAVSDIKRKRNFEDYNLGLDAILGLKPKLYNMDFQKDGDEKQVGLVAQEVKEFIPQAFEQNADFIGLNYNAIIVTMVKAIQELKQEIDTLKN